MEKNKFKQSSPVFIIGCPRSGTSALAHALAQHPDFWTSAESDFLLPLIKSGTLEEAYKISYNRPDEGWLRKQKVSFNEFLSFLGCGMDLLFLSRSSNRRWVDQTPGYTLIVESLKNIFPNALFIHILRDGRLVVNSMLKSNFERIGFNMKWTSDFGEACKTWSFYAKKAFNFSQNNKDIVLEVKLEELSENPEEVFSKIFDFLGARYSKKSAFFIKTKRLNSSYDKGIKTVVDRKNIDKNNKEAIDIWNGWNKKKKKTFLKLAGECMKKVGYQNFEIK